MLEIRTYPMELRELDDSDTSVGRFTGYATVFGDINPYYNEVVKPGAYKKTLKESKGRVPITSGHEPQIGWTAGAAEDDYGLLFEGEINLDVQEGREQWSLMKQAKRLGTNMGLSQGFRPIKEKSGTPTAPRELLEVAWVEVAITPFPSLPSAMVTDMRSAIRALRTKELISPEQEALAYSAFERAADEPEVITEPEHDHSETPEPQLNLHSISNALNTVLQRLGKAA